MILNEGKRASTGPGSLAAPGVIVDLDMPLCQTATSALLSLILDSELLCLKSKNYQSLGSTLGSELGTGSQGVLNLAVKDEHRLRWEVVSRKEGEKGRSESGATFNGTLVEFWGRKVTTSLCLIIFPEMWMAWRCDSQRTNQNKLLERASGEVSTPSLLAGISKFKVWNF
jgi:hypothetical protein